MIRTTCPKKLVMPVEAANRLHCTNVFTGFLSGVQEGLTGQGGNILNKQTCLSIGLTQLYVCCSTVYQLRAVQACAIIGTLLPLTLLELQFCQHHTVCRLWSTFSYKGLVENVFFFDAPTLTHFPHCSLKHIFIFSLKSTEKEMYIVSCLNKECKD